VKKMRKLIKAITASSAAAYALVYSTSIASAANIATWGTTRPPANVPTDITGAIMNITNWILGFIAIIATLVIIWGGVQYLTAAGNEDQVANAKKTISYGIIGVVIAGLAYAMVIVITTVILAQ
jgi:amino acid transporter